MIFENFPLGKAGKLLVYSGAGLLFGRLKNLRGAEDFDDFFKNVLEKFSKIE